MHTQNAHMRGLDKKSILRREEAKWQPWAPWTNNGGAAAQPFSTSMAHIYAHFHIYGSIGWADSFRAEEEWTDADFKLDAHRDEDMRMMVAASLAPIDTPY